MKPGGLRLFILFAGFLVVVAAVVVRLIDIQIVNHDHYKSIAVPKHYTITLKKCLSKSKLIRIGILLKTRGFVRRVACGLCLKKANVIIAEG